MEFHSIQNLEIEQSKEEKIKELEDNLKGVQGEIQGKLEKIIQLEEEIREMEQKNNQEKNLV